MAFMGHLATRTAILVVLDGDAAGVRALAACAGVALREAEADEALVELIEQVTAQLPPDRALASPHALNQEAVPGSPEVFLAQMVEAITVHPGNLGESLTLATGFTRLWNSASSDERPLLRARFLTGLAARQAPMGSTITRQQLREWTRALSTSHGSDEPPAVMLSRLFAEPDARSAQILLAEQLMSAPDLAVTAQVLATLAAQHAGTHGGSRADTAIDSALAATLLTAPGVQIPAELEATLLSQTAHALWWSLHGQVEHQVAGDVGLADALRTDPALARRSARSVVRHSPSEFWSQVWGALADLAQPGHRAWIVPACVAAETRLRYPGATPTPPDAAGAVAAVIARAHALLINAS